MAPRFILTLTVFACLVLAAFLLGRFAPERRAGLGRAVAFFAFHTLASLLSFLLAAVGAEAWAENARIVAELLATLTLLNLGGLLLFGLILPKLGVNVAKIVADITMGAAYFVAFLFVLRAAGLNLSGIIATSAVVTAVLGISLQATLGNILGGLALQLDNSIRVGDWIELEDKRQGRVTEIHWRHTVIETRNWDTIVVPNSSLLSQNITILGKRQGQPVQRRMWVYFNVDFRFSPAEVIRVVDEALQAAPMEGIAAHPAPHCICFDFSQQGNVSVAHYAVRYWLNDLARDDPTSSQVRLRIYSALQRADIPLALPASTIFLSQLDGEHQERKQQLRIERRVAALDAVDLFAPMTAEEKERLAPRIRHALFAPGEVISRQGQEAHWFYVMTRGSCEVLRDDRPVATWQAPHFFGEMGLMTGARREFTVVARSEVECFRIDKEDFHEILRNRPEIAEEMSKILAERALLAQERNEAVQAGGQRPGEENELSKDRILGSIRSFFGLDLPRGPRERS